MKASKWFAIIMAISFSGSCFGQQPTLTINEFKVQELKEFDGNGETITTKKLQEGFILRIKNSTSINKVELKKEGTFSENILPPPTSDANYSKIFTGVKPAVEGGVVEIQLSKVGESPVIVKLIVGQDDEERNDCFPIKLPVECNVTKDYSNKFGEEAKFYDKQKIVYVYDFNKDPSKREFYKITLKRKKEKKKLANDNERNGPEGLNIQVVNFNKETLTSGKNVKFKIYNINKFMYEVSIADSVIHFDSEPSALFTRLFLGDSTLLGSLMGAFSDNIKTQSVGLEDLNKKITCFVENYNWLHNKVLDAYDPCYAFPCCYSIEYTKLANALTVIRADAVKIQMKLDEKKKIIEDNKKELDACEKNEKDIKENSTAITKCEGEIKDIKLKLPSLSGEDKKKKEEELAKKEEELKKLQEDKTKLEKISSEKCTGTKKEEYKKKKETAENELSEISVINTLLTNLPSEKELKKVIVFLRNMVEQNNSHTNDYSSLNGNMLDLTIKIASKDSIFKYFSIPEYKNDPLQIQIPIIGKPFISFSSGSFIGLGKNMQNKTYAWQETVGNNNLVDSSKFTLVESGYTLPPMGFCALGNFEWKLSRSFGLGGSAGVGLSIEKSPRLAYLGGVSLFFGDLRQFTITGGFAGIQVNKLSNNFQKIADNQTIYSSKPNIDSYKEFKVGGFISLTYTPFKLYKTKTVKSKNK